MTESTNGSDAMPEQQAPDQPAADPFTHLAKAADDALTDDMVARLAATAAEGMDLIDDVNRSGMKRALPAIAELVENGDLERLVRLARVFGSAEDALTDEMIARLSETAAGGMDLLDQVLIIFRLFVSFAFRTFLMRWSSTNGPFFTDRGTTSSPYSAIK